MTATPTAPPAPPSADGGATSGRGPFGRPLTRGLAVLGVAAALIAVCAYTVVAFLRSSVPTVDFSQQSGPVHLHVQTVGAIGFGPHPTWVSYLVQSPSGGWVQSTLWQLPANRQIDVTVDEYDSGGSLRNNVWAGVTGTTGGVAVINGRTVRVVNPDVGNGIAHTFNVPDLGINVPLYGVSSSSNSACSTAAPCPTSADHQTISFSFRTPNSAGSYRWQCFVPCGLAYLYGNGGPMQAIGFMSGFLKVVHT